MGTRTGTVQTGDPRAAAQAAAIGATIHPDGWWYIGNKRLTPEEADTLAKQKGAAISGLDFKGHGLGKGTLGDITGGRIGDVHIPPAIAEALRVAAEVGGSLVGIPPQLVGAIAQNIGKGSIGDGKGGIDWGQAVNRGVTGAIQGAGVGGAAQGISGAMDAGKGFMDVAGAGLKGGIKGVMNPTGSYTGLGKAAALAPMAVGAVNANSTAPITGVGESTAGLADASQPFTTGGATDPGVTGTGNPSATGNIGDWVKKLGGKALDGAGSVLGVAGDFLTGNNGLNALGIAQGLNAANLSKQSTDYAKQAGDIGMQNWKMGEEMRNQGKAGLLNPKQIDLSGLQAQRQVGNPFAKPITLANG